MIRLLVKRFLLQRRKLRRKPEKWNLPEIYWVATKRRCMHRIHSSASHHHALVRHEDTLAENVVDGFQGDEWLVGPFQEELASKPTSFGSWEVNNGKVVQEALWRNNGKSLQPSNNVFFFYLLPSQKNEDNITSLFLNFDSAQWKKKHSPEKKQIYDTRFPILRPPNGSSETIIFSRSHYYFTKTFIAAERYLQLQIFIFSSFEFSKQRYHSQTFSTKTSGSINRFWQTSQEKYTWTSLHVFPKEKNDMKSFYFVRKRILLLTSILSVLHCNQENGFIRMTSSTAA